MKFKFLFFTLLVGSFFSFSSCEKERQYIIALDGVFTSFEEPIIDDETGTKLTGVFYPVVLGEATSTPWYIKGKIPKEFDTNAPVAVHATLLQVYPVLYQDEMCYQSPSIYIYKIKSMSKC